MNLCRALQDVNADALMLAYHLEMLITDGTHQHWPQAVGMAADSFYSFGFCYRLFEAMSKKGSDPSMCCVHYSIVAGERKRL